MVAFINTFLSYLLLFVVIVALGAIAIAIGITLAKKKAVSSDVEPAQASGSVNA